METLYSAYYLQNCALKTEAEFIILEKLLLYLWKYFCLDRMAINDNEQLLIMLATPLDRRDSKFVNSYEFQQGNKFQNSYK